MTSSSRGASILAASDRKSVRVEVPEWGLTVEVRSLTARARAEFVRLGTLHKGDRAAQLEAVQPWVIVESAYDGETGEQLFTHDQHAALLGMNPEVLDRLSGAAVIVSGLGKDSREEAGKGSAPTPIGASSSASLSLSEAAPSPSSSEPSTATN